MHDRYYGTNEINFGIDYIILLLLPCTVKNAEYCHEICMRLDCNDLRAKMQTMNLDCKTNTTVQQWRIISLLFLS